MLRNVLADYLNRLRSEREFDLAIATLLPAMGFYDIHFTHGTGEFGKDFIAKLRDKDTVVQYSFQSKRGDINQADWRNNVQGQMLEAIINTLSHPSFDTTLPHQSVLLLTGRLVSNVQISLQSLNNKIQNTYKNLPIVTWDQDSLIERFTEFGFDGVYTTNARDLITYGQFFVKYGEAISGQLSDRKIEEWSRHWCDTNITTTKRIFISALEAELLATSTAARGCRYEATYCYFALLRSVLFSIRLSKDESETQYLLDIYKAVLTSVENTSRIFIAGIVDNLGNSTSGLLGVIPGSGLILKYPIVCARILEVAGLLYFLSSRGDERERMVTLIKRLLDDEPGCAHPVSDRYAVAIIVPVLALLNHGDRNLAQTYLKQLTIWLCDRYEHGAGLAGLESNALFETTQLLGYPFSGLDVKPIRQSFAATAVIDLAACLDKPDFYRDVINDFLASNITFPYWQSTDTPGQFLFTADDVVQYPNVIFRDEFTHFEDFAYAEHIEHETKTFMTVGLVGPIGHLITSLVVRDRYFPTLWPTIIAQSV